MLTARDLKLSLLVGLTCVVVYNANRRAISAGDTYPARYLPFAIWQHHSLRLDPIESVAAQGRGETAFWIVHTPDGHAISLYPVVAPVLLAPLYLPAVAYLELTGWTDLRRDHVARIMEKVSASLVAALSATLLYLVLRRRASTRDALLLTIAYAFGTTTWVISSQASWQHGMAQLLVIGALFVLTGPCTAPRALAAGFLVGLIAGNRPPDAILAAALGAYGLFWAGRRSAYLALGAAIPIGLVLLYNLGIAGHYAGAYGRRASRGFMGHELLPGIGAVLISPMRGLLVFSPFLSFLALAFRRVPRDRGERILTLAMALAVALHIVLYAKADWRAGISFGPRYMTDVLPFLIWMLVPVVESLRSLGRGAFVLAAGAAVAIEAIGAFFYTGSSDAPLFAVERGPERERMRAAWSFANAPFIAALRDGPAPAELWREARGDFEIVAGAEAVGWALVGGAAPSKVAVIIDGRQSFTTSRFVAGPTSPSGWRVPFRSADLAPGEHRLAVFVHASERGEPRFLGERRLLVRPRAAARRATAQADLVGSARTAAARIREHQQKPGFWLTAHTKGMQYEAPGREMNTFTTALLVDLLGPLEARGLVGDSLQRARAHLTAQIEIDGLVRYHGRKDGPGIGTLGCVITPDTDDTALVWRVAPGGDVRQRSAALAEIERYRTPDGLYRTWLAPRERFQCLDPGHDPNPTDVAIQVHLLMLLAEAQPRAAAALCDALRRNIDDDRIWVYYKMTPLVPMLRQPDLRRARCPLELPPARTQTSVAGQEIWLTAVRLLVDDAGPGGGDAAQIRTVLAELARDDFAPLRSGPPLLYHNDLSATVPRSYWSEDVGYALWLRLHDVYAHLPRRR